jgi:4-amino-4-deoxy-L-arabinose transferase-like glycosyltransferase
MDSDPPSAQPGLASSLTARSRLALSARPWLVPLLPAVVVLGLLLPVASLDPARGVTASDSPFTDEAWYALNARNLVLLGGWGEDDWRLHLITLPYALLQAASFAVLGVGIVQARVPVIIVTAITAALLGVGLQRTLGTAAGLVAGFGFATSTLILYYGRLAYAELLVAGFLVAGALLTVAREGGSPGRGGFLAGAVLALAVLSKPTGIAPALGVLLGVAVSGRLDRPTRRWLAGALVAGVAAAVGWLAVALLPDPAALQATLRILAPQAFPRDLGELASRAGAYAFRNDGAVAASAPLLVAGLAGAAAALWAARRPAVAGADADGETSRRRASLTLAAAAAGWFLAGLAVLLVVSYRPDRYVVPLLPALAILGAVGAGLAWRQLSLRPALAASLLALVLLALAAPGLLSHAGWVAGSSATLPAVQAAARSAIQDGAAVEGTYAPAVAMSAPVPILVSRPDSAVNAGDLYVDAGVRWVVAGPDERPGWVDLHPEAWAGRREVLCFPWSGSAARVCLFQLP